MTTVVIVHLESISLTNQKTDTYMIGICSDHAGFELKSIVEGYLEANNREYKDFGTYSAESCDYADFAHPCALAVESGECYPGIAMCGSGNGIAMTLNKHQGIRAALCLCFPPGSSRRSWLLPLSTHSCTRSSRVDAMPAALRKFRCIEQDR